MNRTEGIRPELEQIVTIASRGPRWEDGEVRGEDYHFVGERAFLRMKADGDFLEDNNYGKDKDKPDWKGTLRASILRALSNIDLVWRINMGAAANVHNILKDGLTPEEYEKIAPKVLVVLVGTESLLSLRGRVKERDKDKYNKKKFLSRMREDWQAWQENTFEHMVINREGHIDEAVDQILLWIEEMGTDSVLLVLCGPTGVGKDTIMRELKKRYHENQKG